MAKVDPIVANTTKHVNKKGKLKGKNKKETKALRAMCLHHRLNKHGKMKNTIWNNDGEYCVCSLCHKKFRASFFSDDNIDEIVDNMEELNNQNKFTAVAANAGNDATKYFAQVALDLSKYSKMAKKTKGLAEKQSNIKKKKNKNRQTGSSMYGSWEQSNGGRRR